MAVSPVVSSPAQFTPAPGRLAAGMFLVLASVAAANLPVTIILARTLDPAGYGEFQFLNRLAFVAVSVAQLGLPYALTWAMTGARSGNEQREVYRFAVWTSTVLGAVVMGVALGLAALGLSPGSLLVWLLLAAYPILNLLAAAVAAAARGLMDVRAVAAIRVSQAVCWLGSVVILFLSGRVTLLSAVVALVASQALSTVIALVVVQYHQAQHRGPRPPRGGNAKMWQFARRVYLGHTLWLWNVYLDQVVLGFLLAVSQLGLYAVAAGLTLALNLLTLPISTTAQPVVQQAEMSERPQVVSILLAVTVALVGTGGLIMVLIAPVLVPGLLGDAYLPAVPLVQILSAAAVLNGINSCLYGVLLGLGAPAASSRNAAFGLLVSVLGWTLLLPAFGVTGAAVTSVASYAVVAALMLASVRRRLPGTSWANLFGGVLRELPRVPRRMTALLRRTPDRLGP